MDELVFKFFGECEKEEILETLFKYHNDHFEILASQNERGEVLLSVTNKGSFDKQSWCPLQILVNPEQKISRRKEKRIFQAINYMLRQKENLPGWGDLPGFDDLGRNNLIAFHNSKPTKS